MTKQVCICTNCGNRETINLDENTNGRCPVCKSLNFYMLKKNLSKEIKEKWKKLNKENKEKEKKAIDNFCKVVTSDVKQFLTKD